MPLTVKLIVLAACAATAVSVALPDIDAAAECKHLGGTMSVQDHDIPPGVTSADVRKCVDHPLGRERNLNNASLAPWDEGERKDSTSLNERAANVCYNLGRPLLTGAQVAIAGQPAVTRKKENDAGLRVMVERVAGIRAQLGRTADT